MAAAWSWTSASAGGTFSTSRRRMIYAPTGHHSLLPPSTRTSERTTDLRGVLIDAVPNLHALVQQPCGAPPALEGPVQLPSLARLRIWSGGGHLPVLRYLGDRRGRGIEYLRDERRDLAWGTHDA